jgi:hypothetical protein
MTPIHAITIAAAIVGAFCLVAFIAWEVYRHLDEIRDLGRLAAVEDDGASEADEFELFAW